VEGLVAVLRGVEVVDAGGVTGEGHVGQTRIRILFEKLKQKKGKKMIFFVFDDFVENIEAERCR